MATHGNSYRNRHSFVCSADTQAVIMCMQERECGPVYGSLPDSLNENQTVQTTLLLLHMLLYWNLHKSEDEHTIREMTV